MNQRLKLAIGDFLAKFNLAVIRRSSLDVLLANVDSSDDIQFLKSVEPRWAGRCLECLDNSKSQLRQDLFVLSEFGFKKEGYFVEFGATNGVQLSNTHLLEKHFEWRGLLAEPATSWHEALRENRSANIETDCVWRASGETIEFNEVSDGEYSTIASFKDSDMHSRIREAGNTYDVQTISLLDLLKKHDAPKVIDYLSIDTEGSELEILSSFDFDEYNIRIITCEHNFTPARQKIFELLTRNGYVRKFEDVSKFDDWYVRP